MPRRANRVQNAVTARLQSGLILAAFARAHAAIERVMKERDDLFVELHLDHDASLESRFESDQTGFRMTASWGSNASQTRECWFGTMTTEHAMVVALRSLGKDGMPL